MPAPSTFLPETRIRAAHTISPVGDLTAATIPALRTSVARSLSEGAGEIIVDLSAVTLVDDAGRDGLAGCSLAAEAAHAVLVVTPATRPVEKMRLPERIRAAEGITVTESSDPLCGTFVRGTITGRVLTCGNLVGHRGDHQGTKRKARGSKSQADRRRMCQL